MARYFLCALIFGLLFFPVSPKLDHDAYSYKWQGYLLAQGINPYSRPPDYYQDSPIAEKFPYWDDLQFKDFRPIYPPVSEIIFGLDNMIFGSSFTGTKILLLFFLLGSVFILSLILRELNLNQNKLWFFVANPVVYLESVGTVHNDIIMIFFLLLGILFLLKRKEKTAGVFYALAIGVKLIPLFLLPLFFKKLHRPWVFITIAVTTLSIVYLPFLVTTKPLNLFQSLTIYSQRWTYTPGVFALGEKLLETISFPQPFTTAKIFFWLGMGILMLFLYFRPAKSALALFESSALIIGYLLVTNSVIFPWYVLWILALTPFLTQPWPWITLSITTLFIPLGGYGNQGEQLWRQLAVWVPFYLVFLLSYRNAWTKNCHRHPHTQ